MAGLLEQALSAKDVLKPFGQTETLLYYGAAAQALYETGYLKGKLVAAKNWIPSGPMPSLIKRGSKEEPLSVGEMAEGIDGVFLETRSKVEHLKDARGKISKVQEKIWGYFLPRKLSEFFYATNGENSGGPVERVFFDMDRGKGVSAERARVATCAFLDAVRDDGEFWSSQAGQVCISAVGVNWTGNSFHVLLFLKKQRPAPFYDAFFQYDQSQPLANYSGRWAEKVAKATGLEVGAGHEKKDGRITIDPSQTPSGKLCRAPFSLHAKDAKAADGVCVPVSESQLREKGFEKALESLTPKSVLENIDGYCKLLHYREPGKGMRRGISAS